MGLSTKRRKVPPWDSQLVSSNAQEDRVPACNSLAHRLKSCFDRVVPMSSLIVIVYPIEAKAEEVRDKLFGQQAATEAPVTEPRKPTRT
jgi:hypothetical protein